MMGRDADARWARELSPVGRKRNAMMGRPEEPVRRPSGVRGRLPVIAAEYAREKLALLQGINARLEVLRYQTRLLYDFRLIAVNRYEFAASAPHEIGVESGGWIRQQSGRSRELKD